MLGVQFAIYIHDAEHAGYLHIISTSQGASKNSSTFADTNGKPMNEVQPYAPQNKIRIVTAGSLFDGHDAAINIMRRVMQRSGAEIIHLGHNRSAQEIVETAIQEDVQGIAITSYQGGHNEFLNISLTC